MSTLKNALKKLYKNMQKTLKTHRKTSKNAFSLSFELEKCIAPKQHMKNLLFILKISSVFPMPMYSCAYNLIAVYLQCEFKGSAASDF